MGRMKMAVGGRSALINGSARERSREVGRSARLEQGSSVQQGADRSESVHNVAGSALTMM